VYEEVKASEQAVKNHQAEWAKVPSEGGAMVVKVEVNKKRRSRCIVGNGFFAIQL
jgi:hypothetical protein